MGRSVQVYGGLGFITEDRHPLQIDSPMGQDCDEQIWVIAKDGI